MATNVHHKQLWDAPGILAAIKRKGETLTGLAKAARLPEGACRTSMQRAYPAADKVISDFLEVPLHVLWPDRYHSDGVRKGVRNIHVREHNARRAESHGLNAKAG